MSLETRDAILEAVQAIAGDRPVRWADDRTLPPSVEGREGTMQIFDVPQEEQRELLRRLRTVRREAEGPLGGALRVVFHTPEATSRHYSFVRGEDAEVSLPTLLPNAPPEPGRSQDLPWWQFAAGVRGEPA